MLYHVLCVYHIMFIFYFYVIVTIECLKHHRTNQAQPIPTRSTVCLGGLAHGSEMHNIYYGLGWCVIIQYDLQQFLTKYH